MPPAYKLIYFDGRGLAESTRFILKYGGVEFEDVRVKKEDWPALKEKTPFGHLPVLEHNGKQMGQSVAIARYAAKQVKLAGKDDWENLEIDAIVDTIHDLRLKCTQAHHESDENRKKTLTDQAVNEIIPNFFGRFDAIIKKNNGYLAVGRLTWADLVLASLAPAFDKFVGGDAFGKYSNLKALVEKVNNLPAIKKWIEVRPQTEF